LLSGGAAVRTPSESIRSGAVDDKPGLLEYRGPQTANEASVRNMAHNTTGTADALT